VKQGTGARNNDSLIMNDIFGQDDNSSDSNYETESSAAEFDDDEVIRCFIFYFLNICN
jgi:hypothetical protein